MQQARSISLEKLKNLINTGTNVRVIDVRSAAEFQKRHIPVAENIPVEKIESEKLIFRNEEVIVTTCGSGGGRSERSARKISEQTNKGVFYLEGGTFGWFEHQ